MTWDVKPQNKSRQLVFKILEYCILQAPLENDNNASAVQTALDIQKTNTTQPFVPQTTPLDKLNHTHIPADNNPERSQSDTLVNLSSQFGSQSTTGMVLNSNEEISQSENCLVHSQQWMSTYQFILNQCINHNMLSASRGYEFSEQICTCCNNAGQSGWYYTHTIGQEKRNFERKIVNIFLPVSFDICLGCSKEPSH